MKTIKHAYGEQGHTKTCFKKSKLLTTRQQYNNKNGKKPQLIHVSMEQRKATTRQRTTTEKKLIIGNNNWSSAAIIIIIIINNNTPTITTPSNKQEVPLRPVYADLRGRRGQSLSLQARQYVADGDAAHEGARASRGGAQVRQHGAVGQLQQWVTGRQRFRWRHVQPGRRDLSWRQSLENEYTRLLLPQSCRRTAVTLGLKDWWQRYFSGVVSNVVVGFFLACEDLGRMFDNLFPACAVFLLFFFKVEISSRTLIPLFRPGSVHGGSASWDDCDRVFPDELLVSSFSW